MLIRYLFRYLFGVVSVVCTGKGVSRLLSELLKNGYEIFSVKKKSDTLFFSAIARDYKYIARTAKRCGCKTKLQTKRGAPFYFLGIKHKPAVICGLVTLVLTLFILGETVFSIRVTGNSAVSKGRIEAALNEHGLRVGMLRGLVDIGYLKQNVLLDIPELSWMTVNLTYGEAEIMLWDKTVVENKEERGNEAIVARRNAQIKSVDVISGEALVASGDVVVEGQVLVAVAPYYIEGSWTGNVIADVIAYTVYNTELTVQREYTFREKTGRTHTERQLKILEKQFPVTLKKNPFFDFELLSYEVPYSLFGVTLPASRVVSEYEEMQTRTLTLNEDKARLILMEMQKEYEQKELIGRRILNRTEAFVSRNGEYSLSLEYLCEENIGKSIQIE